MEGSRATTIRLEPRKRIILSSFIEDENLERGMRLGRDRPDGPVDQRRALSAGTMTESVIASAATQPVRPRCRAIAR
jgi:hypothetical protein